MTTNTLSTPTTPSSPAFTSPFPVADTEAAASNPGRSPLIAFAIAALLGLLVIGAAALFQVALWALLPSAIVLVLAVPTFAAFMVAVWAQP